MPVKSRNKHYTPNNRYANPHLLVRKINDMMPVPDSFATDLVLNLSLRIAELRRAPMPYAEENRQKLRQLVADLTMTVAIVQKLALLFVDSKPLSEGINAALNALQRLADCYKESKSVDPADLELLANFLPLYRDMMKQTRMDEYKKAIEAAAGSFKS